MPLINRVEQRDESSAVSVWKLLNHSIVSNSLLLSVAILAMQAALRRQSWVNIAENKNTSRGKTATELRSMFLMSEFVQPISVRSNIMHTMSNTTKRYSKNMLFFCRYDALVLWISNTSQQLCTWRVWLLQEHTILNNTLFYRYFIILAKRVFPEQLFKNSNVFKLKGFLFLGLIKRPTWPTTQVTKLLSWARNLNYNSH